MPLDHHVEQLLAGLQAQGLKSFEHMSVDEARAVVSTFTGLQAPPEPVARVEDQHYVSDTTELPLRIYIPENDGPRPVVLYFHGGGFVAGDLEVIDEPARALANDSGAIVVTATYRRAPEHRFPAAADDAWAALNWVADHIAEYGGEPDNVVVMGDSAGGNLAAVTALRARDRGAPALRGQVLIYPVIDPNAQLPSRTDFAEGYIITAAALDWFWEQYLSAPEDADNPYAVPSRAARSNGLPPTLLLTTENEVARDEAEQYGDRLRAEGVDVRTVRFEGLVHGVYWMSGAVPRSLELRSTVADFVRSVFVTTSAS
ncbi:esterase/ lipase [Rhodococcus ruber BKS 20-38]|uniref:Esterase/ lipase n=1 Tax=Rhodococcus ruber BKS 20-38 TaxID=1278076 RepID=M2YU61_9NOCA|nr:alpha/beta hydrolase [Rhodococcus ruber]EME65485.1 esterase/ lipase [Rhodococcus ruber BKS 20-38]